MDLAALFLLPLLGGYCFAYVWRASAFTTKLAEGHHLYFRAALCGAVFFALTLGVRILLVSSCGTCSKIDSAFVGYVRPILKAETGSVLPAQTRRAEWVVTAVYSLLLGASCGVLANTFTPLAWSLRRSVRGFDQLLLRAYLEGFPVSLTLRTSKVYIGLVGAIPNPTRESVVVTLSPILSGNRDAEGRLTITTDYEAVYSTLSAGRAAQSGLPADCQSPLELLIRADEIVTATRFSAAIYREFNPGWNQEPQRIQTLSSMGTNSRFSGPM
jgi:hypothetical protein